MGCSLDRVCHYTLLLLEVYSDRKNVESEKETVEYDLIQIIQDAQMLGYISSIQANQVPGLYHLTYKVVRERESVLVSTAQYKGHTRELFCSLDCRK